MNRTLPRRRRVVIVGGGFSGAATAIHLSRLSTEPLDLRIVEPRQMLGMGIAHSAIDNDLRLNGPDTIHAPYPDAPDDFARWMRESGELAADPHALTPGGLVFARRSAFGRYMAMELQRHAATNVSDSSIDHVHQRAVNVTPGPSGILVELGSGQSLQADHCILATGWNEVGVPRGLEGVTTHPGWFGNPWATDRFDTIPPGASVLLVGTGLTASDTFAVLTARGHHGPVLSLSRRGLRPASQNPHRSTRSIWDRVLDTEPAVLRQLGASTSLRNTLRLLRQRLAQTDRNTSSWHVPFDEFRDAAFVLWNQWSIAEQRQYGRHLKSWYDAFRFRNPPQTERIVRAGIEQGRLGYVAARLGSARAGANQLELELEERRDGRVRTMSFDAVINCTGPQPRPSASHNPLWRTLQTSGVARDAGCGMGVDVDFNARLIDVNGKAQFRLFAVGPPTMGRFAEVIAVPFIVRGILDVARTILQSGLEQS